MNAVLYDLHQFYVKVRQLGYSFDGRATEHECLVFSERLLTALSGLTGMAPAAKSVLRTHTRAADRRRRSLVRRDFASTTLSKMRNQRL